MLTYADVCSTDVLTYAAYADVLTYAAYHDVMSACAKAGDVQLALQVLDTLVEAGLEASTFTYNILMSVHLRCRLRRSIYLLYSALLRLY
jgi:pentatricopeptide repeat protein